MENNVNKLSEIIGNSVVYYPSEIATMLNKNGVAINAETYTTEMLIDAVVTGLASSPSFTKDFEVFIAKNKEYSNVAGDYIQAGTQILGGVLGLVGGKQQQDAVKAQANAQAKSAQAQLEIAKINQQTELAKLQALQNQGKGSNTGLYIGLGVGGALILGLVVFLAVKK